jgi:phosphatidylserine decarboxylase
MAQFRIHKRFHQAGARIEKGEEIGIFQFGASSIIVAFEKARIQFDDDLVELSKRSVMISVEVGMSLGRAVSK